MFTGQIIGYVGADARQNKNGKGFNFHVSTKYKNVNNEEQTLWVCCFVNYERDTGICLRRCVCRCIPEG